MQISSIAQLNRPVIHAAVDEAHIGGEKQTGYEDGSQGPFKCSNCEHFTDGYCGQSTMMMVSKLPKNHHGDIKVDPNGCCIYFEKD